MKYKIFVQSGNSDQTVRNYMLPYIYTFGASNNGTNFSILNRVGNVQSHFDMRRCYCTSFRLELIMDTPTFQADDILF